MEQVHPQDNDLYVITYDRVFKKEDYELIEKEWQRRLPSKKVLVIDGGARLERFPSGEYSGSTF